MRAGRFKFAHNLPKQYCPGCSHRTLRTYFDTVTRKECDHRYGICDRITNCNYHEIPKYEPAMKDEQRYIPPPPVKRTSWRAPQNAVEATNDHRGNVFAKWLVGILGQKAKDALRAYKVGTFPKGAKRPELAGAMVYWQIGEDQRERSGKVIPYDGMGHRIKDLGAEWVHSILTGRSMDQLGCAQVLFGQHLLPLHPSNPVAIVESEKTAIIASCFYPDNIWLATGGSHGFTVEKCMCLQGRRVTVFPDKGQYNEWSKKAIDIELITESLVVSDIMEVIGVAKDGEDIADMLMCEDGDGGHYNHIDDCEIDLFPATPMNGGAPNYAFPVKDEAQTIIATCDINNYMPTTYAVEPRPIQSPIEKLIATNPAVGKLITDLDLDTSKATIKPIEP